MFLDSSAAVQKFVLISHLTSTTWKCDSMCINRSMHSSGSCAFLSSIPVTRLILVRSKDVRTAWIHFLGTKVNLLNQVLGIVIGVCLEHQQQRGKDFDQMPFQRIFIMLFYELCAPEEVLVSINWHTLQAFTQAYHHLRPAKGTIDNKMSK